MPHFALNLLRIVSGALFAQHGAQKLFAVLGRETAVDTGSLLWTAGVLEFYGGIALVLGLFTRPIAFVLSGLMAFAYFLRHAEQAFFPIQNSGELAALYCFVFLYLAARGGGAFSIDGAFMARRRVKATE